MARTISRKALVAYSAEQMFNLVNDIESYPQFLPNCTAAVVHSRSDTLVEAELTLSKAGVHHRFATRNTLQFPTQMTLQLLSGPFKQFDGCWSFKAMNGGCEVSFSLTFAFSNFLLNAAAGKWMEEVANLQVDAVCKRAKVIYC